MFKKTLLVVAALSLSSVCIANPIAHSVDGGSVTISNTTNCSGDFTIGSSVTRIKAYDAISIAATKLATSSGALKINSSDCLGGHGLAPNTTVQITNGSNCSADLVTGHNVTTRIIAGGSVKPDATSLMSSGKLTVNAEDCRAS